MWKERPPSTILSFSKGLGLGCGFLVHSFHMSPEESRPKIYCWFQCSRDGSTRLLKLPSVQIFSRTFFFTSADVESYKLERRQLHRFSKHAG